MGKKLGGKPICLPDDGSAQSCGFGACETCSNSPRFTRWSRTISTRNAASQVEIRLRRPQPPLSTNGAGFARGEGKGECPG